jgi:hypothetical protein
VDNIDYLTDSYIRRKRWEWEQQAIYMVNALSKAMTPEQEKKQASIAQLNALGIGMV